CGGGSDYKGGDSAKRYADEMLKGGDLQLRLYLLAMERFWGIVPAGALYLGFGDGVRHGAIRADLADRVVGLGLKGQTVRAMEGEEWDEFLRGDTPRRIAALVDRLARVEVVVRPRDGECGFCELRPICRYERYEAGETEEVHA